MLLVGCVDLALGVTLHCSEPLSFVTNIYEAVMLSCTRVTRIPVLVVLLLGVACSDDTTTPQQTPQGEVGVDASTDTDTNADSDATPDEQAEATVDQPTVSSPISGAVTGSPVEVIGEGEPDALVTIELHHGDDILGDVSTTAGSDGAFRGSVAFESVDGGSDLALHVVQTTAQGTSAATVVDLVQGAVPDPPTLESPQDEGFVSTPLPVRGNTEPGATVFLTLREDDSILAQATTTALVDGAFSYTLEFARPEPNSELTLSVVAENEFGESDSTVVGVVFLSRTLAGTVEQTSDTVSGTEIFVSLLSAPNDYLEPLQTQILTITDPELRAVEPFTFDVVPGTYYIRAFRDVAVDGEPDGYPSVVEPQSGAVEVVVDDDVADVVIELVDSGLGADGSPFRSFDAHTLSQAIDHTANEGCGGLSARFVLVLDPDVDVEMTAPLVRTPDGRDLTLLDDGACEDREGSSGSFDDHPDDSFFTAGTSSVDDLDGGLFVLHSRLVDSDFLHIEADTINVVPLRRHVYLTRPSGADSITSTRPTLVWAGATEGAWVRPTVFTSGEPIYGEWTQDGEYTLEEQIADDSLVSVSFLIADSDPEGGDVDAYARSSRSTFVRDAHGDTAIEVEGSIRNTTGLVGNINIKLHGTDGLIGAITIDSESEFYQIAILPQENSDTTLEAFIEVDDVQVPVHLGDIPINGVDLSEDASGIDLWFRPLIRTISPVDDQSGVGNTPTLVWEDSSDIVPDGPFQHVISMQDLSSYEGGDYTPEAIWIVAGSQTSFDISDPPLHFDMLAAVMCGEEDGVLSADGSCSVEVPTSLSDLSANSGWSWAVMINIECDFDAWANRGDSDDYDVNTLVNCLFNTEASFAGTGVRMFSTD